MRAGRGDPQPICWNRRKAASWRNYEAATVRIDGRFRPVPRGRSPPRVKKPATPPAASRCASQLPRSKDRAKGSVGHPRLDEPIRVGPGANPGDCTPVRVVRGNLSLGRSAEPCAKVSRTRLFLTNPCMPQTPMCEEFAFTAPNASQSADTLVRKLVFYFLIYEKLSFIIQIYVEAPVRHSEHHQRCPPSVSNHQEPRTDHEESSPSARLLGGD